MHTPYTLYAYSVYFICILCVYFVYCLLALLLNLVYMLNTFALYHMHTQYTAYFLFVFQFIRVPIYNGTVVVLVAVTMLKYLFHIQRFSQQNILSLWRSLGPKAKYQATLTFDWSKYSTSTSEVKYMSACSYIHTCSKHTPLYTYPATLLPGAFGKVQSLIVNDEILNSTAKQIHQHWKWNDRV